MATLQIGSRLGIYEILAHRVRRNGRRLPRARHAARARRGDQGASARAVGDDGRGRLWREARAAASVNHPERLPDLRRRRDGEQSTSSMELLDGEPLSARLAKGPLRLDEAVADRAWRSSARSARCTPRDRPSRSQAVERVPDPHGVKLLDFGLARASRRRVRR